MGINSQSSVPKFTAGEVLTAANMNISAGTGVPVFDNTTQRDAAFGGTGEKVLAEGQLCYVENLTGVAQIQYYDGSSWVSLGAGGLQFITSSTFSAVASVSVNDCFSSTYNNYRVIVSAGSASITGGQTLEMRLRVSGADNTSSNYNWARFVYFNGGSSVVGATDTAFELNGATAYTNFSLAVDVIDPQTTNATQILSQSLLNQNGNLALVGSSGGVMTVTTSYTGFTLFPSSGTFSGTIAVYGYQKA